jgi:hypothetical protein
MAKWWLITAAAFIGGFTIAAAVLGPWVWTVMIMCVLAGFAALMLRLRGQQQERPR